MREEESRGKNQDRSWTRYRTGRMQKYVEGLCIRISFAIFACYIRKQKNG